MTHSIISDCERQDEEMAALSSIYDETEFFYSRGEQIKCTFNVFYSFPKKLEVKVSNCCTTDTVDSCDKIFIEHLPPIRLYVCLPDTYPSKRPPNFRVSIVWLPPWEISFICQKLDEIWQDNQGGEILFLWTEFLRNDFIEFLGIQNSLDVSFMYTLYTSPNDTVTLNLTRLSDSRAINGALFINPETLLMNYNQEQHKLHFNKTCYTCYICFDEYKGEKCIELKNCGHVYCKDCMQQHICSKIECNVTNIMCPTVSCNNKINTDDIKSLCPNMVPRYEDLVLRIALDTMDDIIYCPKVSCQYPIIRTPDDPAPICPNCKYCFCIYCCKIYHGTEPCELESEVIKRLTNEYKNSDDDEKLQLERKYGKRQIELVQKHLTTEYLQENTKSCPKCHSSISKIDGCNKMTCGHCHCYFCWLCGKSINHKNPYQHFINPKSSCYGRLLDGVEQDVDNLYEEEILF